MAHQRRSKCTLQLHTPIGYKLPPGWKEVRLYISLLYTKISKDILQITSSYKCKNMTCQCGGGIKHSSIDIFITQIYKRPWNSYYKRPRQTLAAQSNQLNAGKVTPGMVYVCYSILLDKGEQCALSLQIHNQQVTGSKVEVGSVSGRPGQT